MKIIFSLLLVLISFSTFSQDTLPNFTLTERADKVTVSWVNPYPNCVQLNVQRSYDSLNYFQTVYSAVSPQLPQNGFTENKMPTNKLFYRIFYVLEGGAYFFSKSRRLGGSFAAERTTGLFNLANTGKNVTVKVRESLWGSLTPARFRIFRDSILRNTKDTLLPLNDTLVQLLPYSGQAIYRTSLYIFTIRDGVSISLPNAAKNKYSVKFYEEDGSPLFNINHIKESQLILDKSNFVHAGWFLFELYEDDVLKEKNKLYLSKDF